MPSARLAQAGLLTALGCGLLAVPLLFLEHATPDHALDACFSAGGRFLARSNLQGVTVFDVRAGQVRQRLDGGGSVAFSRDGRLLACGGNTDLTVWDWRQGRPLHRFASTNRWCARVAVSPDGGKVAGADDESLRVWDTGTGGLLLTVPLTREHDSLAFSPDGGLVILAGSDGKQGHAVRIWAVAGGELKATLAGPERCYVRALAVSPDGKSLATGLSVPSVRVWDIAGTRVLWEAGGLRGSSTSLAFSPDASWLLVGGYGEATLFDLKRAGGPTPPPVPPGPVEAVAPSDDPGELLMFAGGTARSVNAASGKGHLIGRGLTTRSLALVWAAGVGFVAWAAAWTAACRAARRGAAADAIGAERFSWAAVLATACGSAAHWGLLLALAWWEWRGPEVLILFVGLFGLGLAGLVVLIVQTAIHGRRLPALACSAFCAAAIAGQMLFDLSCVGAIVAAA
jgi:hypothetical protein